MSSGPPLILAIESAISGGSVSLLKGESVVAQWIGRPDVPKAEELLARIDDILVSSGIPADQVKEIAVSAGPGSFTGIRIGIATALGLKNGLGVPMSCIPLLRAMIIAGQSTEDKETVAAVPVGRGTVCFQSFRIVNSTPTEMSQPETLSEDQFRSYVQDGQDRGFVLHTDLYDKYNSFPRVINFGSNLAYAIGLACQSDPSSRTIKPLFVSKGS